MRIKRLYFLFLVYLFRGVRVYRKYSREMWCLFPKDGYSVQFQLQLRA